MARHRYGFFPLPRRRARRPCEKPKHRGQTSLISCGTDAYHRHAAGGRRFYGMTVGHVDSGENPGENSNCAPDWETFGKNGVPLSANSSGIDPQLVCLIQCWPHLPEPIRAGILAMVQASS